MSSSPDLTQLTPEQLRQLAADLITRAEQQDQVIQAQGQALQQRDQVIQARDQSIQQRDLKIGQLTHEVALLKRHKYGQRSEHLNVLQISLLDEVVDADIAGIETELEQLKTPEAIPSEKRQPKRLPLPPELPRTEIHHEPDNRRCRSTITGWRT